MLDVNGIKAILAGTEGLIKEYETIPLKCSNITTYVEAMEIAEEVQTLRRFLTDNEGDFITLFREHALERAHRNAGTSLSFITNPAGFCNMLYWQLTEAVFGKQTLGEKLSILQTEVTTFIELEFYCEQGKKLTSKHVRMRLNKRPIAELDTVADREELANFVVCGSYLFDVRQIAQLDLPLHQTFYRTLKQDYPELVAPLYQHNAAFNRLYCQLQLVAGSGQTPEQAICSLMISFILGGETITGQTYAQLTAQQAFTEFLNYLAALPAELSKTVRSLTSIYGKTLNDVLDDLHNGGCVELASSDLKDILDNPDNMSILTAYPHLSQSELGEWERQYKKSSLSTVKNDDKRNHYLPAYHLKQILPFIVINKRRDYLSLLPVLPPELYSTFLQEATINSLPSAKLGLGIKAVLNKEQRAAFYQAILANKEKFWRNGILNFAAQAASKKLLIGLLTGINPENRLGVVCAINNFGSTVLHDIVTTPSLLQAVLKQLPESDRLSAILSQNGVGDNVMRLAMISPQSIKSIVEELPPQDYFTAFCDKNSLGNTILHWIVYDEASLEIAIKALFTQGCFAAAVNLRNNAGDTVVHRAAARPQSLQMILGALSEEELFAAIKEKDQGGQTLLSRVSNNPESLEVVLKTLVSNKLSDDKLKLFLILEKIINNIEGSNSNRWTSGKDSPKVKHLRQIQDRLLEKDNEVNEFSLVLKEALTACHIKRNPIHFWSIPHSVNEFSALVKEQGWQLENSDDQIACFR